MLPGWISPVNAVLTLYPVLHVSGVDLWLELDLGTHE